MVRKKCVIFKLPAVVCRHLTQILIIIRKLSITRAKKMLPQSFITCFKQQIRICNSLGFKNYRFFRNSETLVELIPLRRNPWATFLLAVVTLFGVFVTFNGLYVIYRVSGAQGKINKFGFAPLIIISMTSIAMFADVMIYLFTLRKSMTVFYPLKFVVMNTKTYIPVT